MAVKNLLHLAREALRYQNGVAIPCSDPQRLRSILYQQRAKSSEAELHLLEFRISPLKPDSELWIVPRGTKDQV
jgi:hypothetical protein